MLEQHREEIDRINSEIVDLVRERMNVVEEINKEKIEKGIPVRDERREEKVVRSFKDRFEEKGLDSQRGGELAELLIGLAVDQQEENR